MGNKWLIFALIAGSTMFTYNKFLTHSVKGGMQFQNVSSEPPDIHFWFEGNSKRVRQKESVRKSSYVWDGIKVYIHAARNEYEPFQLILRADQDVRHISINISDLTGKETVISKRNIKLYKIHYVSAKNSGAVADPLVPLRGPIDLIANMNQPIWVRIYIPEGIVRGSYTGAITISYDGVKKTVPLEVYVWGFSLPETPTLFRVSPHWESSSFVKETYGKPENYVDLVYAFYRELRRMGVAPAQSFDLKKMGTLGFSEKGGAISIDFAKSDPHIDFILNELSFNNLDIEFYYSPVGRHDPHRGYPFNRTYTERVSRYLSLVEAHYRNKGWLPQMWVQHYGDEPCQTCEGGGHLHPSYQAIRDWSKLFRSAAPDLKVLLSEHPTPQLVGAVDIWNAPWHLLKRGDVRERHEAGENVIAYSCDSKLSSPLMVERANLWNLFSEEADGCWSWHLYEMGDMMSTHHGGRYSAFYNGIPIGIKDEPVLSLRSEMMGEGKDDWEYLRLIEKKLGKYAALSLAKIVARRPGPLGRSNVDEEGLYEIRTLLGKILNADKTKFQDDLVDLRHIAKIENLSINPWDDGSIQLDNAEPPKLIEDFEEIACWKPRGPVKAMIDFQKMTTGKSSMKGVFNKGMTNPDQFSLSCKNLLVTDWSEYDILEFDVYTESPLSLFDISITFNDEYGSGYRLNGKIDWKKGDQVHAIGQFSQNGSFPGKWRHIRIDFADLSGIMNTSAGREKIESIHFRMGGGGTVNEPLPNTDYVVYIDNMTLQKKRYKRHGYLVSTPLHLTDRANKFGWISDYRLPINTGLRFESRSGHSPTYDPKTWSDWAVIDTTGLFTGKMNPVPGAYVQYKAIFTSSGIETPTLRGVTIH